jgi:hypothetical protein
LQVAFDEAHYLVTEIRSSRGSGLPGRHTCFLRTRRQKASKAVLGIILSKESEVQLHKWFRESPAADLRYDIKLQNAWIKNPKIHEIRSASDMVHPASPPENPIIAAYDVERSEQRIVHLSQGTWAMENSPLSLATSNPPTAN